MYQALYRQYRPKTFDEVLGQNHITRILKNQIQNENIGHAYLFSGTRGTGKTSTAKIFSRAVNCLETVDGNPCNQCKICKGILDETIMDIVEMDAASNRGIDDIRELRDKVIYPPSNGKFKVYIIDEVHMLTIQAFNALLKTLEEPPKHLLFILATTEPERLPQTILSRCQRFDFRRVTSQDIIQNMKKICHNLDMEVEDRVFNLIARNADGAMRDALSLLDQCLSFSNEKISYEDAIEILDIVSMDLIFDIVDSVINKDTEEALFILDRIIQNGKDVRQFLKDLIYHFRNLMIIKSSKNPVDLVEMDEEAIKAYIRQREKISLDFILRSIEILTDAEEKVKWSNQPRIILEVSIIQLISLEERLSLEERITRLEEGISSRSIVEKVSPRKNEGQASREDKPRAETEKPKQQDKAKEAKEVYRADGREVNLENIQGEWEKILQVIKGKRVNVFALLMEGEPISYSNDLLTIGYKENFGIHREAISTPANYDLVKEGISHYFNKSMDVKFIMMDDQPPVEDKEKIDKDKLVKDVIDFFGEDIVEIK